MVRLLSICIPRHSTKGGTFAKSDGGPSPFKSFHRSNSLNLRRLHDSVGHPIDSRTEMLPVDLRSARKIDRAIESYLSDRKKKGVCLP